MMRTFISGWLVLMGLCLTAAAQEADTAGARPDTLVWITDFDQGLKQAASQNRYMLVDFYADW